MAGPSDDDDQTIRLIRPVHRSHTPRLLPAVVGAAVALVGITGWFSWRPSRSGQVTAPTVDSHPVLDAPLADEATILATPARQMRVFRFRLAPSVLVLSFPSLRQQGDMLDRVAAFVEKAGLPHDRVLSDAELDAAIEQAGDTRETYYYGHDYRAADLARFFAAADRTGAALNSQEVLLRDVLRQAGMLAPGANGALITIPPEVAGESIDATSRATILHHELAHGLYFTDTAYAAYVRAFWQSMLTEPQRAGFRRFLAAEGYDTSIEDLVQNEAQAYLIHTRDPRYFQPERAGLTTPEAALLRQTFLRAMPDSWLKTAAIRQATQDQ